LTSVTALAERERENGDLFLKRLADYEARQTQEIARAIHREVEANRPAEDNKIDADLLATRVAADISRLVAVSTTGGPPDPALLAEFARMREDEHIRLDHLAGDIRQSVAKVSSLLTSREGVEDLSLQVAEATTRSLEAKITDTIAKSITRQAPDILSAIRDDKLSEVVSRTVREANRPLFREFVASGRGVPLWLFASLLIPLLLILGYLFLPGELGFGEAATLVREDINRLTQEGVPLAAEDGARLQAVEGTLRGMYDNAWSQVKNAGSLEAEIAALRKNLAEREALLGEYNESLTKQSKRLRDYEIQLTRLGISPDSVPDSAAP
jgi:hypothetical protein